jgi:PAS domain S-box-containing protein/putative nucleotidyltransferase with HDIG domain
VLINISSVPGSNNTVAALLDLSSLKQAEKGFAQQWDSLAAFMDSLPAMLCLKDTEGKIIRVNQRFADFISLAKSEIEGSKMSDLMPDNEGQFDQQDEELVREADPWIRVLWRFPVGREIRSAWLHKTPVLNDAGDVKGIMVECVDVTEHEDDKLRLLQDIEQLEKTVSGSIEAIARIVEMRDPYTSGHQRRVALLAGAIAEEMGLPADQVNCIAMASKIHDIGKVYVPIEILSKPGNLNETERQIVNTHAAGGYDILKHIEFPWPVADAVYQHHERLDGSGYPRGLRGNEIILPARIIMVADVVEAMSVYRPHRPAFTIEAALIEISGKSGIAYDEEVVNACLRLFRDKDFSL